MRGLILTGTVAGLMPAIKYSPTVRLLPVLTILHSLFRLESDQEQLIHDTGSTLLVGFHIPGWPQMAKLKITDELSFRPYGDMY